MEREIVTVRIRLIIKYLNRLRGFESVTLSEYLDNFDYQLMVERLIELLVESSSDINSYLLLQLHNVTPATYYDSFIEAGKNGLTTRELAGELAKSSGMRNRLVHQYEAIDNELVFKAIPIALSQFPLYLKQITDYLDSLEVKDA
ncbi:type VII toxin-antitoxin system HepT family RNase toxin [Microcystis aeruginosa]|uniref:DUF86 domain-containing protein n=1 Tax=Microcystis aeruginosa PCC 9443 TaxID=1160281 RepID=I4FZH4_MICAE|nr:DUF86 domain-containing protein [Microcystis aeruginosa]CCI01085.1 conserved hypothetical protein [Microcystis aeruginosa PCC 9443]